MATYDEVMNSTTPTDVDYTIPEIWSEKLRRGWMGALLFSRFMGGDDANMPIVMKSELEYKAGDKIYFEKVAELSGDGQTGDTTRLKGNEEKLVFTQVELEPEFYRHAVSFFKRAQDKSIFDLRPICKDRLSIWLRKKVDDEFYDASLGGTQVIYQGTAAASGGLTTSHIMSVDEISRAAATLRDNDVPEVADGGGYVALLNTFQAYQLNKDEDWITARQNALESGVDNPIFKHFARPNYIGSFDGVHLFESSRVPRYSLGASGYVASAIVMGAEAFAFALGNFFHGKLPVSWAEEVDDYQNEFGVGIETCYDVKILEDEAFVRIFTRCDSP